MGGRGSGEWYRYGKKAVVEDCRQIEASRWMREGILKAGVRHTGGWCWFRDASMREKTSSIGYEVCTHDRDNSWLRLFYTIMLTQEALDYRIRLTTTFPQFGGLRWWFICPLVVNGVTCGRRVGKLYLHGRYYGCRQCHGLTYRSCQEHDKRVTFLCKHPDALDALLAARPGVAGLSLALKALDKMRKNLDRGRF